jgi:hypothetical protein
MCLLCFSWETNTGDVKLPTGWYNCCVINTNGFELKSDATFRLLWAMYYPSYNTQSLGIGKKKQETAEDLSPGMWRHVISTNVSEETAVSIFRASSTLKMKEAYSSEILAHSLYGVTSQKTFYSPRKEPQISQENNTVQARIYGDPPPLFFQWENQEKRKL